MKEAIIQYNDNTDADGNHMVISWEPLVRCKDCKHWEKYSDIPNIGNCPVLDQSRRCDWFCADGERK